MKNIQSLFCFLLITTIAHAQSDSNYLFKQGNKIEISNFMWKGFGKFLEFPKINYEVKDVRDSSGFKISTLLKSSSQNKGKSIFKKEIQLKDDGKDIYYDLSFWLLDTILHKEIMGQANIKTDTLFNFVLGDPMTFPLSAKLNDNLKPYTYQQVETDVFEFDDEHKTSTSSYSGNTLITTTTTWHIARMAREGWTYRVMNYDDRKITAIEKVTTPAGTWSCYKIVNKDTKAKGLYKGMSLINYFSPDFGLIRTEMFYNKRLLAYSEITKVY